MSDTTVNKDMNTFSERGPACLTLVNNSLTLEDATTPILAIKSYQSDPDTSPLPEGQPLQEPSRSVNRSPFETRQQHLVKSLDSKLMDGQFPRFELTDEQIQLRQD